MSIDESLLIEIIEVINGYEFINEEVKDSLINGDYKEELKRFRVMIGELEYV